MYIITYKYIKYIKPFYEELQEPITVNYPKICTFLKKVRLCLCSIIKILAI